jgi:hypothetical protein
MRHYAGRVALTVGLAMVMVAIAAQVGSSRLPAPASDRTHQLSAVGAPARGGSPRRLVFGIYPGGAVGTVGPAGPVRPEVAELRLQALRTLRGATRPFVLHVYDSYTRPSDGERLPKGLASQIRAYAAEGFDVELVLTYRPARRTRDADRFADFVRARVRRLGGNPNVTHLQVTNEVNVRGAPNAADGAYPGARAALVRGTIAAAEQARHRGSDHLRVGFSWAYQRGRSEQAFFTSLGKTGGRAFAKAVDWVGLNLFPGTWGPDLPAGDLASGVRSTTLDAIRMLRRELLPRARLEAADVHVSEAGYPTGPGRTEAMQETALRASVEAVADARAAYRVTGFRWFDLRDADSMGASIESRYGLMRDDYSPKPAFFAYRDLIATLD